MILYHFIGSQAEALVKIFKLITNDKKKIFFLSFAEKTGLPRRRKGTK